MKNLIILNVFLITSCFAKLGAQRGNLELQPINCDEYIQRPGNTQFVGTWIGSLNGKTLQLELKNVKANYSSLLPNMSFSSNTCIDMIYGFHKYVNNNSEIENTLSYSNSSIYEKKWTILGASNEINNDKVEGTLEHTSKNKSVQFSISYIDPNHIKIESLENVPGLKINELGKPPYDSSISLPSNIVLTKQ